MLEKIIAYNILDIAAQNHSLDAYRPGFQEIMDRNPLLERYVEGFLKKVRTIYNPIEANLVERAVILGCTAHQKNEHEKKRYRKEVDEEGKPLPYFIHPLEMAERMITPPEDEKNMHFDWLTLAATLLHDVPEDVLLNGIEKEKWFDEIKRIYADQQGKQDILVNIIDGVTEKKLPERTEATEQLYEKIEKTPIFKIIAGYIEDCDPNKKNNTHILLSLEEKQKIADISYSLEHLFQVAIQSPNNLRVFLIKIADLWSNSKTFEHIKGEKHLRGRIAANLADYLGWSSMRDELVKKLAEFTDVTTPFAPNIHKKPVIPFAPTGNEEILADIKAKIIFSADYFLKSMRNNAPPLDVTYTTPLFGFGVPTSYTKRFNKTTLPAPMIFTQVSENLFDFIAEKIFTKNGVKMLIPNNKLKSNFSSSTIKNKGDISGILMRFLNNIGVERLEVMVHEGKNDPYILRIDRAHPHIVDLFLAERDMGAYLIDASSIPEYILLHTPFKNTDILEQFHIHSLIAYMYEPLIVGNIGNEAKKPIPLFDKNTHRLYFFPNTISLQEIIKTYNIKITELEEIKRFLNCPLSQLFKGNKQKSIDFLCIVENGSIHLGYQ